MSMSSSQSLSQSMSQSQSGPAARPVVVHISVEVFPFAKVGGMADVAGSLPVYLARHGYRNIVFLPYHGRGMTRTEGIQPRPGTLAVVQGGRRVPFSLRQAHHRGVEYFFIDCPAYFDRLGIYEDPGQPAYADTVERTRFFCHAVCAVLEHLAIQPAHVFSHEWLGSLALHRLRAARKDARLPRTYYIVHNFQYQIPLAPEHDAVFDDHERRAIDTIARDLGVRALGPLGLAVADRVVVVSPNHLRELRMGVVPGHDNQHVFAALPTHRLVGLLNGIDHEIWTFPARYAGIPREAARLVPYKRKAREDLYRGRDLRPGRPMLLFMNRLDPQKGIDFFHQSQHIESILDHGNLFVLGTPDGPAVDQALRALEARYPDRFRYCPRYEESLAREALFASDMYLMPSVYEPCGLTQLYAMRYGSVPIARAVGGLRDTIACEARAPGAGTGFLTGDPGSQGVHERVLRALALYTDTAAWTALVQRALDADHSWETRVRAYVSLMEEEAQSMSTPISSDRASRSPR